jgi:N-methylhydantoinase A
MILGVDTGGTFTDFVLLSETGPLGASLQTHKVLSTPDAPERAILQGISEMGLADAVAAGQVSIIHGSTVATNAALEGKGVATAFITNRGFRDILTIARQTRPALYQLETPPIVPPVPRKLCLEADGRIDARGQELVGLNAANLQELVETLNQERPASVAISLLFCFLDPRHEQGLAEYLEANLDYAPFITASHDVLPEYREYERGIATWLNATLGPLVRDYILRLQAGTAPSSLSVMQSSGGTIDAQQASRKSVNLLLSGPAGGLAAVRYLSEITGEKQLMTFDMGGTSTDVALVDGELTLTTEGRIGDYPVAVPMVDMHTIGAGGGSIAQVDAGGLLQVGPRSAGANPGPACYGQGGQLATVTDANLVLGRLQADAFLGGTMTLDIEASRQALAPIASALSLTIEEAALGIIRVANEHMARALRVISVARGHAPGNFRLCCFGGAGGLHICALADAMGMNAAMVPVNAGVLSAKGMFLAPVERQLSRTNQTLLKDVDEAELDQLYTDLETAGVAQLQAEGITRADIRMQRSADCRYAGQSSTLTIPWQDRDSTEETFHQRHQQRYGHRLDTEVELVNLRLAARHDKPAPVLASFKADPVKDEPRFATLVGIDQPVPLVLRSALPAGQTLAGPALITEHNATTWLAPGWTATPDTWGNLMLHRV